MDRRAGEEVIVIEYRSLYGDGKHYFCISCIRDGSVYGRVLYADIGM
jgi:hypothetical protein